MKTIRYKSAVLIVQYQYDTSKAKHTEGYVCFVEFPGILRDIMLGYFDTQDEAIEAGKVYVDEFKRVKKLVKRKPKKKTKDA